MSEHEWDISKPCDAAASSDVYGGEVDAWASLKAVSWDVESPEAPADDVISVKPGTVDISERPFSNGRQAGEVGLGQSEANPKFIYAVAAAFFAAFLAVTANDIFRNQITLATFIDKTLVIASFVLGRYWVSKNGLEKK